MQILFAKHKRKLEIDRKCHLGSNRKMLIEILLTLQKTELHYYKDEVIIDLKREYMCINMSYILLNIILYQDEIEVIVIVIIFVSPKWESCLCSVRVIIIVINLTIISHSTILRIEFYKVRPELVITDMMQHVVTK